MATPQRPGFDYSKAETFFDRRGGDAAAGGPVDLHTTYPFQNIAPERQAMRRGMSVYRPDERRYGRGVD